MMVAKSDEEALKRLGTGGGFFSFGIMHYYLTGMHPGRTKVWERYQEAVKEDPTLAYGPGRGAIGSPDTVREFLRGYEASGVDEIILLLNPAAMRAPWNPSRSWATRSRPSSSNATRRP